MARQYGVVKANEKDRLLRNFCVNAQFTWLFFRVPIFEHHETRVVWRDTCNALGQPVFIVSLGDDRQLICISVTHFITSSYLLEEFWSFVTGVSLPFRQFNGNCCTWTSGKNSFVQVSFLSKITDGIGYNGPINKIHWLADWHQIYFSDKYCFNLYMNSRWTPPSWVCYPTS